MTVGTIEIEAGTKPIKPASGTKGLDTLNMATGELDVRVSALLTNEIDTKALYNNVEVEFRQRFIQNGTRLRPGETFLTVIRSLARMAPNDIDEKVSLDGFLYPDQELGVTVEVIRNTGVDKMVRWADVTTSLIGMTKAMVSAKKFAEFEGEYHSLKDEHGKEQVFGRIPITKYKPESGEAISGVAVA